MFLLQFSLGLKHPEVHKQEEEVMLRSHSLLLFFLNLPFPQSIEVFVEVPTMTVFKSPGQTFASFPVVDVPFHIYIQLTMDGLTSVSFQSVPLPTSASDTNSDGRYGIYECLSLAGWQLRQIRLFRLSRACWTSRFKAIIWRLKAVYVDVLNRLFFTVYWVVSVQIGCLHSCSIWGRKKQCQITKSDKGKKKLMKCYFQVCRVVFVSL